MADLFQVGISGIKSYQEALNTVSNNISNTQTPGYSRQELQFVQRPGMGSGVGYIGSGVEVAGVHRKSAPFLLKELVSLQSDQKEHTVYSEQAQPIESLLESSDASIQKALTELIAAMHNASIEPESMTARTQVIARMDALQTRFHTLNDQLGLINDSTNLSIKEAVDSINVLTQSIANLNRGISEAAGKGRGQLPNDLLDQRDKAVRELSDWIGIQSIEDDAGNMNVFARNGQNLVLGAQPFLLQSAPNSNDPSKLSISISGGMAQIPLPIADIGGGLSGYYRFQTEVLDPLQNRLDLLSLGVAQQLSAVHEGGYNLYGETGLGLYADINSTFSQKDRVFALSANSAQADLGCVIEDVGLLQTGKYRLEYRLGMYSLYHEDTGALIAQNSDLSSLSGDGMHFVQGGGSFSEGDSYRIQPTVGGMRLHQTVYSDPKKLAFAAPEPAASLGYEGGDNRQALAMIATIEGNNLLQGSHSYQQLMQGTLSLIGLRIQANQYEQNAAQALHSQLEDMHNNLTGVNIDEETMALMEYERAYQACAKVLEIGRSLFETLITMMRGA